MIKAVFLDVDNTLLDFNKGATLGMEKAFNMNGLEFKKEYNAVFKVINDELWRKVERREITRAELHRIRFNLVLKELNIEYDGYEIEKTFLELLKTIAVPIDGALDLAQYLSSKYILCSASNAPYIQQMGRLKTSGLLKFFKHNFISEEIGFDKPSKEFFDVCFSRLDGITKEQTVMIGDSLTADIKGAKDYGIKSIWFNFEKVDNKEIISDYTVDNLKEIKDIL